MVRDDKPTGFFYLDHRTVDARYSIITDTHVTPASVHDSQPYLARLDRQRKRFGFHVQAVGLDAGYFTPAICQGLEDRGIDGVMGYRTPNHKPGFFYKRDFRYSRYREEYTCPQGQVLRYSTTNRAGYQEFRSDPSQCGGCPVREKCTTSANQVKVVIRHVAVASASISPRCAAITDTISTPGTLIRVNSLARSVNGLDAANMMMLLPALRYASN
jgi:hypothetical protein